MWTQIVGKFRLAQTPWINHSWQAAFYVSARGLTTSLIPGAASSYEVVFDLIEQRLHVDATDGRREILTLEPMSVAQFHARFVDALARLGAPTEFHHAPNEVPAPVPFREQTAPGAYDPDAARDFWRALVAIDGVLKRFRPALSARSARSTCSGAASTSRSPVSPGARRRCIQAACRPCRMRSPARPTRTR